jgi:hypothetical protein
LPHDLAFLFSERRAVDAGLIGAADLARIYHWGR